MEFTGIPEDGMLQMEKYQATVLAFLFDKLPIGDDVGTLEFSLSGNFTGKYLVAHSAIGGADGTVHIVFTLPGFSRSVLVALTRTNTRDIARILANLEDYERESSIQLELGHVIVTPEQERKHSSSYAVILLRTATSLDCANVPDRHVIDGKETSFFLAVPITQDEWKIRQQHGHDALMDRFQDSQKQLFF